MITVEITWTKIKNKNISKKNINNNNNSYEKEYQ